MKSLAGVAANTNPFEFTFSPCDATDMMAEDPAFAIDPNAFSTMFAKPPRLFPGVGFALRSARPSARYSSYQRISRTNRGLLVD